MSTTFHVSLSKASPGISSISAGLFCSALFAASLLLSGCASSMARNELRFTAAPEWIVNRPNPLTHFVGIGSARAGRDLYRTRQNARNSALREISEQIEVSIAADVQMSTKNRSAENTDTHSEVYRERIATFTKAVLTGWKEINTWHSPDGFCWSMVVLSKRDYYSRIDREMKEAVASIADIINGSSRGDAYSRICALNKGLEIIDGFLGVQLRAVVDGREVVLRNEINRRLSDVLSGISIRPNAGFAIINSTSRPPDTLGAYVFFMGKPDSSLPIAWSSSDERVSAESGVRRSDGLNTVFIRRLPPSDEAVGVTVSLGLGAVKYGLLQRGFSLPSASISVRRERAQVFCGNGGDFCRSLADRLAGRNAITIADSIGCAEYVLISDLENVKEPVISNSIYLASANLDLKLVTSRGNKVVDINKNIRAADGRSASGALYNTRRLALDEAVKRIEEAF